MDDEAWPLGGDENVCSKWVCHVVGWGHNRLSPDAGRSGPVLDLRHAAELVFLRHSTGCSHDFGHAPWVYTVHAGNNAHAEPVC